MNGSIVIEFYMDQNMYTFVGILPILRGVTNGIAYIYNW